MILFSILSFAGGAALNVGVDLFIIGGASSYGTAALAAKLTVAACSVMATGVGFIMAAIVAGGYFAIKSNWTYEEANE
jgi:hypothetical protein